MEEFYGVQMGACASDPTMIRVIRVCRKCGAKIFSDVPEEALPGMRSQNSAGHISRTPLKPGSPTPAARTDLHGRCEWSAAHKKSAQVAKLLGEFGDYELLEEIGSGRPGRGVSRPAKKSQSHSRVKGHWPRPMGDQSALEAISSRSGSRRQTGPSRHRSQFTKSASAMALATSA